MADTFHRPSPENPTYQIMSLVTKKGEDEEFDNFVKKLCGQIRRAKKKRKFLEDDWNQCERNYYATNEFENVRESNLDFTITFEICQDASSNLSNAVLAQDTVFMAQGRPGFKQLAAETDSLLDWMSDQVDFSSLIDDTIRGAQIYTKCICKCGWEYREEKVKFWDQDESGQAFENEKVNIIREGCYPYVVDTRRFFHPMPCVNLEDAAWLGEEFDTTIENIQKEIDRGFYRKDLNAKNVGTGKVDETEVKERTELAAAYGEEEVPPRGQEQEEEEQERRLMEVYTTYKEREVILWLDVSNDDWVAAVENFFQSRPRPYEAWSWYPILNSVDGKSLCSILDPMHAAYAAILNILLDSGIRSIEPLIVALKSLGLSEYFDEDGKLGPGLTEVDKMLMDDINKGIKVINLTNGSVEFLINLLGKIEQHMHDAAAIPRAFRGQELAERPTATGTSAIIEKAMQPLFKLMERYRRFLGRVAQMMYARYRQFNPQSMQIYLQAQGQSGEQVAQTLTFPPGYWEDQVLIETKVNSQTMSKSIKKQEALAMMDKWPEMWQTLAQIAEAVLAGQTISPIAAQALDIWAILFTEFMTEFEVPEVRDVLDIDSAKMVGEAFARTISQHTQIIEGLAQEREALVAQVIDLGGTPVVGQGEGGQQGPGMAQGAA